MHVCSSANSRQSQDRNCNQKRRSAQFLNNRLSLVSPYSAAAEWDCSCTEVDSSFRAISRDVSLPPPTGCVALRVRSRRRTGRTNPRRPADRDRKDLATPRVHTHHTGLPPPPTPSHSLATHHHQHTTSHLCIHLVRRARRPVRLPAGCNQSAIDRVDDVPAGGRRVSVLLRPTADGRHAATPRDYRLLAARRASADGHPRARDASRSQLGPPTTYPRCHAIHASRKTQQPPTRRHAI